VSQFLDGCGIPPSTLHCTRLADLVTIDPKLVRRCASSHCVLRFADVPDSGLAAAMVLSGDKEPAAEVDLVQVEQCPAVGSRSRIRWPRRLVRTALAERVTGGQAAAYRHAVKDRKPLPAQGGFRSQM
jgi:hypothetical protein